MNKGKYNLDAFKKELKGWISENRYKHSLNVMETAENLAIHWNADVTKCKVAGLLHDCGKLKDKKQILVMCDKYKVKLTKEDLQSPKVIHSFLGEKMASMLYGVEDTEILQAIRYHTTGEENITLVDKIVFLADYIEPGRRFKEAEEVRKLAFLDIDKAMLKAYDYNIRNIILKGDVIHLSTIKGRNYIIISNKEKEID